MFFTTGERNGTLPACPVASGLPEWPERIAHVALAPMSPHEFALAERASHLFTPAVHSVAPGSSGEAFGGIWRYLIERTIGHRRHIAATCVRRQAWARNASRLDMRFVATLSRKDQRMYVFRYGNGSLLLTTC